MIPCPDNTPGRSYGKILPSRVIITPTVLQPVNSRQRHGFCCQCIWQFKETSLTIVFWPDWKTNSFQLDEKESSASLSCCRSMSCVPLLSSLSGRSLAVNEQWKVTMEFHNDLCWLLSYLLHLKVRPFHPSYVSFHTFLFSRIDNSHTQELNHAAVRIPV